MKPTRLWRSESAGRGDFGVRELRSRFCDESPEAKQNLVLAFYSVKAAAKLPHSKTEHYHLARMRYFRTDSPLAFTGTSNWAANAAVFVDL